MSDSERKKPRNDDERKAWDAFAQAGVVGWLAWNDAKPVFAQQCAQDAALIADVLLEERRKPKHSATLRPETGPLTNS